jgi:hypothetical protein
VDREIILEHLTHAEQRIGYGECEATRLRRDLTQLERAGDATMDARQALQLCEQSQALHRAERARLLAALSASKRLDNA